MQQQHIHWFPGHMAKAKRLINEHLKLVDVVVELLDARIPSSSANPMVAELVKEKPRIVALNKADLAEETLTNRWITEFNSRGLITLPIEAASGRGVKKLLVEIERAAAPVIERLMAKGIRRLPVRAMIIGIPNVGKSSLINRLLGSAVTKTGDRPGVTRGKQWIKVGNNLDLLDTPGVLWPKLDDQTAAFKLAITGAIPEEIVDRNMITMKLLEILQERYMNVLTERYGLKLPTEHLLLKEIGKVRGCLLRGGVVDLEKAQNIVINDFRTGKLGRITLDLPDI